MAAPMVLNLYNGESSALPAEVLPNTDLDGARMHSLVQRLCIFGRPIPISIHHIPEKLEPEKTPLPISGHANQPALT